MARNKDLPSKLRRAKRMKQGKALSNWVIQKTSNKVRSSPYSRRTWRNTRLKRD
ncbi:MAG: 50S ribosomal protein L39 [Promethearchaeota archaeon]